MTRPSEPNIAGAGERSPEPQSASESVVSSTCCLDAALLFRCMEMLRIDRGELAADDPLLFRELQGRCTLCRSRDECVEDVAEAFDDERWVKWRMYCPNSAMLIAIGTVQNCVAATVDDKTSRS